MTTAITWLENKLTRVVIVATTGTGGGITVRRFVEVGSECIIVQSELNPLFFLCPETGSFKQELSSQFF